MKGKGWGVAVDITDSGREWVAVSGGFCVRVQGLDAGAAKPRPKSTIPQNQSHKTGQQHHQ
jgi:hypothetical protein